MASYILAFWFSLFFFFLPWDLFHLSSFIVSFVFLSVLGRVGFLFFFFLFFFATSPFCGLESFIYIRAVGVYYLGLNTSVCVSCALYLVVKTAINMPQAGAHSTTVLSVN